MYDNSPATIWGLRLEFGNVILRFDDCWAPFGWWASWLRLRQETTAEIWGDDRDKHWRELIHILPIYFSICLCIYIYIYISIYLSRYLSIYLSIHPSIHLGICLSILLGDRFPGKQKNIVRRPLGKTWGPTISNHGSLTIKHRGW